MIGQYLLSNRFLSNLRIYPAFINIFELRSFSNSFFYSFNFRFWIIRIISIIIFYLIYFFCLALFSFKKYVYIKMFNYLKIIFKCDLILQIFFLYFGGRGPFLEGTYANSSLLNWLICLISCFSWCVFLSIWIAL